MFHCNLCTFYLCNVVTRDGSILSPTLLQSTVQEAMRECAYCHNRHARRNTLKLTCQLIRRIRETARRVSIVTKHNGAFFARFHLNRTKRYLSLTLWGLSFNGRLPKRNRRVRCLHANAARRF